MEGASPFMASRLPSLPRAAKGASMGQLVLLTPSRSSHRTQLFSRQQFTPISPLPATLMNLPTNVANKRLTRYLNPLDATLTKNRGWGALLYSRAPSCSEWGSSPCASDNDAHPESANGGGADSRFRPCRKGLFSRPALGSLFSLFAPRVFHNSLASKRFRTLSQNCRGVTLQFPFWEAPDQPQASNRHSFTSFHRCLPEPVDIQPLAGHNFPSAPSPSVAPITEEGE